MKRPLAKVVRSAILNTAWRVRGQRPPTKARWLDHWLEDGGRGIVTELSPAPRVSYPPAMMRGNVQAIASTMAALPDGMREWYEGQWNGQQVLTFAPKRVATLHQGRVFSNAGLVVGEDDVQIQDFSGGTFGKLFAHCLSYDDWLPKPRRIKGSVAVLACGYAQRNYYHWVSEALPRVSMFERAGLMPDYYFVPVRHRFHVESLRALGIHPARLIAARKWTHLQVDQLYVTPHVGMQMEPENCQRLYTMMAARPWSQTRTAQRRNIYIARRARDPRHVMNETEVLKGLRRWRFEKHYLEDLSLREQVQLFQQADMVVGPHGAGLVNITFCNPGTRVIEIGTPARPSALFYTIAHNRALRYCVFYGEAVSRKNDESDIRVNVPQLVECVDEMHTAKLAAA